MKGQNWFWNAIWKILERPVVFRGFAALVGLSGKARKLYVRSHLRVQTGDKILDIGCGPGDFIKEFPPVSYTGVDMNGDYIQAARKRYGARAAFHQERVSRSLVGKFAGFDLVMANGLMHHLNDDETMELLEIAQAALQSGGRFVSLDGVYSTGQTRLARYFVSRDRGRFVRTEQEYLRLARKVFPSVTSRVYEGLLRIPYSLVVMEGVKA